MEFFDNDQFAQSLGAELIEAADDAAVVHLPLSERHLNGHGTVHGGVIFALGDIALGAAANTNASAVGVQVDVKYMAQPKGVKLVAKATPVSLGRTLATYQIIVTDEFDNPVAHLSAMGYRFKA